MVWRFYSASFARDVAERRARRTGVRMRVTRCAEPAPGAGPWMVYPTPAASPSSVVVEPCS